MKNLQRVLFVFSLLFFGGFAIAPEAKAATYDVCAAGCDFTRIEDAFNSGLIANDIVTVGPTYDRTGDNSYLAVPSEVILNCENSGAILGSADFFSPIYMSVGASSTVINCTFAHTRVIADNGFDALIQNNTLTGNSEIGSFSTIGTSIVDNEGEFVISTYLSEDTLIQDNTLSPDINGTFGTNFISINLSTSTVIERNNLIANVVNDPYYHNYIYVSDSDTITIQENLIDQSTVQQSSNSTGIFVGGSSHIGIIENRIYMSGIVAPGQTMIGIQLSGGTLPTIADIIHNTIKMDGDTCNSCAGIAYTNWSPANPISAIAEYNLIAGEASSTAEQYGITSYNSGGGGLSVSQSWMSFAGLRQASVSNDVAIGPDALIMNVTAAFKDEDGSTANDWELTPYSNFLDIDGMTDAGAISGVRENEFIIDQGGTLDYVSTHALDTARITHHVRTGDTLNFSSGTYSPITLSQHDRLASNVILNGTGPTTIIENTDDLGSAISFNGISDSIVNGLSFSGSSVTTTYTYTLNKALFSFGGNDYNEAGNLGVSPTTALLIGPACSIMGTDGPTDITDTLGSNPSNINIALVQAFGFRLVAYVPNAVATTGVELTALCGFTVDAFVNSALFYQGNQTYSYDAGAIALAGVTLIPGESDPTITSAIQERALVSNQTYSLAGTPYIESTDFGATTEGQMLLLIAPCTPTYVSSPSTLARINNPTNSNWNLLLIEQGGFHATVLAPASLVDSIGDLASCGAVNVDAFVEDVFIYANGGYTYNAAAVALAGLTLNPGQPNPPFLVPIDHTVAAAGISLMNSHDNIILFSTVTNNDNGVAFIQSSGNSVINSTLATNSVHDIVNLGDLENTFQDTSFNPASSLISGAGGVTALFSARVQIQDALANPLDAMNVTLSSSNNATSAQMITDVSGNTPYVIFPAFRLSSTDITETAGGYNPQLIHVDEVAPFFERNVTSTLNTPFQTFIVDASIAPPVVPVTQTTMGGGALITVKPTAINNGTLGLALDRVEKLGNGLVNIWVRLNGNPNTVRGFSLSTDPALKNTALQNLQEIGAIAVSNTAGNVTIYGRYYSTTGEASELYSLTIDISSGMDIESVPTTPGLPTNPGDSNQCLTSPFTRDLQTGMVAEDVRQLQIYLNAQGFAVAKAGELGSKGKETMRFGAGTRGALKAFQKANRLPETGIMSAKTRELIQSLTQKSTVCKAKERFARDLRTTMIGDDVKALQQFLNAQGFLLSKAGEPGSKGFETRYFGAATRNSLNAFQKANALTVTGILSGITRQKVNQLSAPPVKAPAAAAMSPFMKYIPWKF